MDGGRNLNEAEAKQLLKGRGITTTEFFLPRREELASLPLRYPLAVKLCSSTVLHKTEVGGVYLDVPDLKTLESRYDDLKERFPNDQVIVEAMEPKGPEVIVGMTADRDFGPSIMFGVGGVMAELYKDVSFRTLPITRQDATEMTGETKADEFFKGFRGMRGDRSAVVDLLLSVSRLADDMSGEMEHLDLNPVILRESGYVVVDAKLVLKGE